VFNHLGFNPDVVFKDDPVPGGVLSRILGQQGSLPSTIIAGAQKSGTTTLAAALSKHPEISAPVLKEPFYFGNDIRYAKGEKFYRSNFPSLDGGQKTFEASTNYFDHPKAAERIKTLIPTIKVIVLLRNPIERAFSHFRMQSKNRMDVLSFEEALANEEERILIGARHNSDHNYCYQRLGYRSRGEYSRLIQPWTKTFGADQIRFVIAEDFFKDPIGVYNSLLEFCNLNPFAIGKIDIMNANEPAEMSGSTRRLLQKHYSSFNEELGAQLNRNLYEEWQ
jgi:hypothetical protein